MFKDQTYYFCKFSWLYTLAKLAVLATMYKLFIISKLVYKEQIHCDSEHRIKNISFVLFILTTFD